MRPKWQPSSVKIQPAHPPPSSGQFRGNCRYADAGSGTFPTTAPTPRGAAPLSGEEHMATTNIKEVARRAGVSIGTVSNVLNRPGMVSQQTRQRVLDAIDELGYVRNDPARQLRAGRSR